jgi:hypothetical protein
MGDAERLTAVGARRLVSAVDDNDGDDETCVVKVTSEFFIFNL